MINVQSNEFEKALEFCLSKNLSPSLTKAILTHTKYDYKENCVFNEVHILKSLPPYLRQMIANQLAKQYFGDIGFFNEINKEILGYIALKMKNISINAGNYLFKYNEYAQDMYIIKSGILDILYIICPRYIYF